MQQDERKLERLDEQKTATTGRKKIEKSTAIANDWNLYWLIKYRSTKPGIIEGSREYDGLCIRYQKHWIEHLEERLICRISAVKLVIMPENADEH